MKIRPSPLLAAAWRGSLALALLLAAGAQTHGAEPAPPAGTNSPAPAQLTARQDHRRMMDLLQIKSLRPGRNGSNPKAANFANYDEAKATPFPSLPDPLVLKSGQKVSSAETWWKQRRPEILEDFERDIYGRTPKTTPRVTWEVTDTAAGTNGDIPVIVRQLAGHVDNSACPAVRVDIAVSLTLPARAPGPVPVMMQLGFVFRGTNRFNRAGSGATNVFGTAPQWQQLALSNGWGFAILNPVSVQEDTGSGLTRGIIGLVNRGQPRKLDDWGALAAWAWGASRVLDYFETDKSVDARRIGLAGHSRYGKATLLAMALDPRFAIAYASSSGEGGAKLHRRDFGEVVENLAGEGEYHWMAGNFLRYAGPLNWNDLPVDAHELIALCAPRPVFIGGGVTQGDGWVDTRGSFLAAVGAGPVYRLLGGTDLGTAEFPAVETALTDGDLAFRQHSQGHTDAPNWPVFLDFARRHFQKPPPTSDAKR